MLRCNSLSRYNTTMLAIFSSWQFLVGISITCLAFGTLLQRVLSQDDKSDPVAYAIVFQILVAMLIGIFAFFHGFHMPNLLAFLPNILVMMVLYAISNVMTFKALSLIEASEFTVFYATRAIWTILSAVFFLGEHFSILQFAGTLLILVSVLLVTYKKKKFVINKGILFVLLGSFFLGIAFTNDAYLLRYYDLSSYLVLSFFLPSLPLLFLYPKSVKHMKNFLRMSVMLKMVSFCTLYAVAALAVYGAYQVGRNAAELGAISQFATILTVLLAIVFLKESTYVLRKIIGAVLAFIGVVLIGG